MRVAGSKGVGRDERELGAIRLRAEFEEADGGLKPGRREVGPSHTRVAQDADQG